MPFIKRDENQQISSVSLTAQDGHDLCTDEDIPELEEFLQKLEAAEERISGTDLPLVRVLEDLIDLLIKREVIRFTDLPSAAQLKLLNRRNLREGLSPPLDLLGEETHSII